MSKPSTRQELIDYCLRRLGHPVITINIDDDQLQDRVDEALQYYAEFSTDGVHINYRAHTITAADVSNKYIPISEEVLYVTRLLPYTSHTRNMFSLEYQMYLNDAFGLRSGGDSSLVSYVITQQYLSLLQQIFSESYAQQIRFTRHMNQLQIDTNWGSDLKEGDIIVFECYSIIDPETHPNVYNDTFLKLYLTALIKRNWGVNLKKFSGMQLPGGVEMNGQQIFEEAQEEIKSLEDNMYAKYTMPPIGFVG